MSGQNLFCKISKTAGTRSNVFQDAREDEKYLPHLPFDKAAVQTSASTSRSTSVSHRITRHDHHEKLELRDEAFQTPGLTEQLQKAPLCTPPLLPSNGQVHKLEHGTANCKV